MNNNTYHCECGGFHVISIEADEECPMLYIEDAMRVYGGWVERIKLALKILFRGECGLTEIILTPEVAGALAEEILIKSGLMEEDDLSVMTDEELDAVMQLPRVA